MENILIFGHKNPDTDSICSSLAYASLKNRIGVKAKATRLGNLNKETEFILDRFGFEKPELLKTVRPQIKDLTKVEEEVIFEEDSLKEAMDLMIKENYSSLPVVDKNRKLEGMVHVSDIASAYLEMSTRDIFTKYETTFENIIEATEGTVINGELPKGKVKGRLIAIQELSKLEEGDIVITSTIAGNIENACNKGATLVVVCANKTDKVELDFETGTPIMVVHKGIFKTHKLISQSVSVKSVLTKKEFYHFNDTDFIEEIQDVMKEADQTNFPVVDKKGRVWGTIRTKHILNYSRKEVILVDHNERSQSVDGIESAKILEIVDHHKFGNFETNEPLMIRAETVGCSSTIIYGLYRERGLTPEKNVAGLMLSAILSDTLLFKSPTCTDRDIEVAKELAEIVGINVEEYGMEMLIAGTSLDDKTATEIITMDMKPFSMGNFQTAIAQVNTVDLDGILGRREELEKAMNDYVAKEELDLFLLVMTDIVHNGSKILAIGEGTELVENGFGVELEDRLAWLPGVVSRKKQVVPSLLKASH